MRIYNSLNRELEEFRPPSGQVKVYTCGVTVYDRCHLGHAFSAVTFDVIVRTLRERFGPEGVKYVVNFTDIDDKVLNRARERGEDWKQLVTENIETYFEDMDSLNVARADSYPRATEHIDEIVELVRKLTDKELAYVVEGDGVYFHCPGFEGYGKLSGRKLDDVRGDGRVERDERFRHPADFCLWKFWDSPDAWESPWGKGRPGWHIECSAMAEAELGLPLDIHGGGMDLKFPHHENEIAQSEGAGADPFARVWMHNGLLELSGKKMGKSDGNTLSIADSVARYGAGGVRHYFLGHLYRHPLKFDDKQLEDGAKGYARIVEARDRAREVVARPQSPVNMDAQIRDIGDDVHRCREAFSDGLEEDFNTAQGLAAVHDLVKTINKACGWVGENLPSPQMADVIQAAANVLDKMMKQLGFVTDAGEYLALPSQESTSDEFASAVEFLLELRHRARQNKDFETSDLIRDKMDEWEIEVQDGAKGSTWKRK